MSTYASPLTPGSERLLHRGDVRPNRILANAAPTMHSTGGSTPNLLGWVHATGARNCYLFALDAVPCFGEHDLDCSEIRDRLK